MNEVGARVAGFPRPLLFTVGAAATAVGIHWFSQRSDGEERAARLEDSTPEPALLRTAQVFQVTLSLLCSSLYPCSVQALTNSTAFHNIQTTFRQHS